jgi:hypothetical protein
VVILTFGPGSTARHERAAQLPLDDDGYRSASRTAEE